MRLAYNEATCKIRSSLETDLDLCRKFRIRDIELRFDMLKQYLENHTETELVELFHGSCVTPITLNAIFDINFCSEKQWDYILEQLRFACHIGRLLDVHCVIVLPTVLKHPEVYTWQEIKENTISSLKNLAEFGSEDDMKIAFEPIGEAGRCVRSIREAWEIVSQIPDSKIGLALDAYNLYLYKGLKDVRDISLIDPERIFIVHINDAADIPIERLGTFDRRIPGDGVIDVESFVREINTAGYQGAYSIEILNQEYWTRDPWKLFKEAYKKTWKILSRIEKE